ncbi:Na+/H+ antiporter [Labilithrix luteola]|uniref:Na+/H+ antiporter n=1 Tax=Labilithrix luteola TaxID=1391654 RepID=A0A0K1PJ34_9BACT|nr:Na+/H+ antiporter [Labilithrix luteola]AKU93553.1 Na+/H+ antiporter [Labilithrix luteola]
MHTVSLSLILLAVVALTNGFVRAIPVPLPLLQIFAGALLAWPIGMHVELEPELFLLLFIPPLLFVDGWRIPKRDFRRFRRTILLMAFGLVIFTVFGLGLLAHAFVPSLPLPFAFALASALSPTDAVAVAGITGRARVPRALMHILQGEALMNDASGLVCLRVAIAAIATGTFSLVSASTSLVVVAVGGVAIGTAAAWVFARAQRFVFGASDDAPEGRILLVLVLPYVAYLVAEHVHCSGILAAAAAGMVLPRLGIFEVGERVARRQTMTVLGALELALNGLVFVLLGLQLPEIAVHGPSVIASAGLSGRQAAVLVFVIGAGLFALRFAWVWVSMRVTLYRRATRGAPVVKIPLRLLVATALAGVRGAVSLAAALTIPAVMTTAHGEYPARAVGVYLAAAVIVMSLLAGSIGLPLVLRGIELPEDTSKHAADLANLRAMLAEAAISALEREREAREVASSEHPEQMAEAVALILDHYRTRVGEQDHAEVAREALLRDLRLVGLGAERARLQTLWEKREVDDVLYREALHGLDVTEEALAGRPAHGAHG